MPHYGVGTDPSSLDKEIEHGRRTHGPWTCRLDKQTPKLKSRTWEISSRPSQVHRTQTPSGS